MPCQWLRPPARGGEIAPDRAVFARDVMPDAAIEENTSDLSVAIRVKPAVMVSGSFMRSD
jgi:hypothetical protein